MACTVSFLVAVLLGQDTVDPATASFTEAIAACNRSALETSLKTFRTLNDARSVETLIKGYKQTMDRIHEIEKEQEQLGKDMEEKRVTYDNYGRYLGGNAYEFALLQERYNANLGRLFVLELYAPRILETLEALDSEHAIKGRLTRQEKENDFLIRTYLWSKLKGIDPRQVLATLAQEQSPEVKIVLLSHLRQWAASNPEVRRVLLSTLSDPYWQVRVAALESLRDCADRATVPKIIAAMKGTRGHLAWQFEGTLEALTGITKHADPTAWEAWWKRNQAEFLEGGFIASPAERALEGCGTTFYGLRVLSERLVLLIDISGSMLEETSWTPSAEDPADKFTGRSRMDAAKHELKRLLRSLPDGVEFTVIFFDRSPHPLAEKLTRMNRSTRGKFIKAINAQGVGDGTGIHDALVAAFGFSGGGWRHRLTHTSIDTIILLTDGMPTNGILEWGVICEKVRQINRLRKIQIHTIAIAPSPEGERFLKTLAQENGGTYLSR